MTTTSSIEGFVSIIQQASNVVFFGGAGVSTESQIPDFRSSDGLYNQEKYAHSAEYLLSHSCFLKNPKAFFQFYRNEMIYPNASPNAAHNALAKLEAMGKLRAVITQNIDGLHQKAGSKQVLELHGSIHRNICHSCDRTYPLTAITEHTDDIPTCSCGGIIKPDVVLYEEALDEAVVRRTVDALLQADVLIVGGTSLRVYPAAGFLRYFKGNHIILINQEETNLDDSVDLLFREPIGQVMGQVIRMIEQE